MTFEDFLARQLDGLLRYATTLTCDPHQAQDIVQEVVLRAQQRWSRISRTDQPAAYVTRMVTNEFLSWRRRRSTRELPLNPADLTDYETDQTGRVDDRTVLLASIATLPRKQRAAVVGRYYLNRTDDEIATELGCTAATVRSHISRAIATLRTRLDSPRQVTL
ncbi:SigE family RNA polymerase sigma factor [Actinokineospora inagensis]|uniref:SigE family RNA polymerase sigma factor n=1 Tax=Actinokineospora inagensis TaxID=103730 RepID=UPI0003F6AAC4|nr:SigE family RNA polymerase sigma factor [Actinokineospora inagensis]